MEVIEPSSRHTHTIINLHGRDSNASDYCKEFFESEDSSGSILLATFPTIKWVFPTAPHILSERFQCSMSQWFDMWNTNDPQERDSDQLLHLRQSVITIAQLVRDEGNKIGMNNIILCGISQGGALALATLLDLETALCAYIGIATWFPRIYAQSSSSCGSVTPIFLAHCQDDEVIGIEHNNALQTRLEQLKLPVEVHTYVEGGHWINEPEGVDDIVKFLRRVMQ